MGALCGLLMGRIRHHPFLAEVRYVWELKQRLNRISRKLRNIEAAARESDKNAMLALQFSYAGSRQLWQLDVNPEHQRRGQFPSLQSQPFRQLMQVAGVYLQQPCGGGPVVVAGV